MSTEYMIESCFFHDDKLMLTFALQFSHEKMSESILDAEGGSCKMVHTHEYFFQVGRMKEKPECVTLVWTY